MYKRIVCATDFSEASMDAVRTAASLAKSLGAELRLVHVVVPVTPVPDAEMARAFSFVEYEKAWQDNAEQRLAQMIATQVSPSVPARYAVLLGQPATVIDRYAITEKADLIVVATHGMTGLRHYLLGSVAQKIVQHTTLPVLLVRGS